MTTSLNGCLVESVYINCEGVRKEDNILKEWSRDLWMMAWILRLEVI